jgi:protein phosphatase
MTKGIKILVFGDIHGNAEALRAVMDAEKKFDHAVFLGDALLSGPQANETAQLLNELGPDVSIMGNHDEEVFDHSLFAHWPAEWIALNDWIIERLDSSTVEPLRDYLPAGKYEVGGLKMFLHHGEIDRKMPAVLPDAPDESFHAMDGDNDCPLVLFGHTHVQFTKRIGDKTYINPGSVGQPRCGKLHACYGVFEGGRYSPRQVTYDPTRWLEAIDRIDALTSHPTFRQWLKDGLLNGYGIGEREPWTRYAAEGFN